MFERTGQHKTGRPSSVGLAGVPNQGHTEEAARPGPPPLFFSADFRNEMKRVLISCCRNPYSIFCTGTFIRRRTKKASAAAIKSKTMATAKTPAHPAFGSVNLAAKGVQTLGNTVSMIP